MRYERKLIAPMPDAAAVRHLVRRHPARFVATYPPRWINNIYFDTPNLAAFRGNQEGIPNRWKLRIRWYGPFFGETTDPVLELKLKHGAVGSKERFPLPGFVVDERLTGRAIAGLVARHGPRGIPGDEAVVANHYRREYYESADRRFRLTIDSEVTSYGVDRLRTRWRRRHTDHGTVLVEVKYDVAEDQDADRVCGWFQFRVARNSKYAVGVARTIG